MSAAYLTGRLNGTPLVVMLDIDGTLCDIVERPDDARVPGGVREALRTLAKDPRNDVRLAFVTGRSIADAQRMIGGEGAVIYGNHGMERSGASGNFRVESGPEGMAPELRAAVEDLSPLLSAFPGASIEDKCFTVSLHFRRVNDALQPELEIRAMEIARRHALRVSTGKRVINLLPTNGFNKGDAVLQFARGTGGDNARASVLFVGDDTTDEDAFVALGRELPDAVTVHVGTNADSAARFAVESPGEVHALVALLAESRL